MEEELYAGGRKVKEGKGWRKNCMQRNLSTVLSQFLATSRAFPRDSPSDLPDSHSCIY